MPPRKWCDMTNTKDSELFIYKDGFLISPAQCVRIRRERCHPGWIGFIVPMTGETIHINKLFLSYTRQASQHIDERPDY